MARPECQARDAGDAPCKLERDHAGPCEFLVGTWTAHAIGAGENRSLFHVRRIQLERGLEEVTVCDEEYETLWKISGREIADHQVVAIEQIRLTAWRRGASLGRDRAFRELRALIGAAAPAQES